MANNLTAKQDTFIRNVLRGVKPSKACELAGFAAPHQEAIRLMKLPKVRQALQARRQQRIEGDLAGVALTTMHEIMTGETVPAAQRFQASKWVLEHAGHAIPTDGANNAKPLEELSPDELATAVQSGMQALRELAGQLAGHHVIEGQVRELIDVQAEPDDTETADFLL